MIDYILVLLSDLLFASQFLITKIYSKNNGKSLTNSLAWVIGVNLIMLIYLFALNGFSLQFSWFSFGMSILMAFVTLASGYCSIAVLQYANLSLYSLFTMLGSVVLSSLFGIAFLEEGVTVSKVLCILLVVVALSLGVEKSVPDSDDSKDTKKRKLIAVGLYLACFTLNGLSGIISKIHQINTAINTSSENFMVLYGIITVVVATIWLLLREKKNAFALFKNGKNLACMGGYAVVHGIAQLLSLISLIALPVSIQQPMVAGGVLLFTFLISLIIKDKQNKKSILAFAFACMSMLAILLPF